MKTILSATVVVCLVTLCSCNKGEIHKVKLSETDLSKMVQGWGVPSINKTVTGKVISIAGVVFDEGVGTHSSSEIIFDLHRRAVSFQAFVGINDDASGRNALAEFRVEGDGRVLWESGLMRPGDSAKALNVNLRGIRKLALKTGDGGNGIDYDHTDWAGAVFLTYDTAVISIGPNVPYHEEQYILTPKPGPEPRINGARIFGVRPGSPFLFKIPATGERPLKYEVTNLPEGLSCDEQSGIITGNLSEPGEYKTVFRVSNSKGTAEREFRIVCGKTLALTPHMGWNSWYIWENSITDSIMRKSAEAMVTTGMIDHGYQYINIDDCWAVKPGSADPELGGDERDRSGNLLTNKRFPDMKSLTDYIHALGLKAGIYTSPGTLTCAGHTGAYGYEEKDVKLFSEWGYDFLKYDWCSYGRIARNDTLPDLQKPYLLVSSVIEKQDRDIILNICQYGMGKVWKWGKEVGGNSWRTAGDLGLTFEGIAAGLFRDGFDVYSRDSLHLYAGPGGWNDPDYLLMGYLSNWRGETKPTPLTPNEQYTQFSLWSLVAAPLIFSGDITRLDDFTLGILTNDEVIEVNQDPLGKPGFRIYKDGESEIWKRELEDGSLAVGLFNRGNEPVKVTLERDMLGIRGKMKVRDLWRQKDLGTYSKKFTATVPRHGVVLVRIKSEE